jgi:hypothetical protein
LPRKRRQPKRRALPESLAQISLCERAYWSCRGPLWDGDLEGGDGLTRTWPDVDVWARFYGSVREELYGDRPWLRERSVAEAMYQAWLRGEDAEDARQVAIAARPDPRRLFHAS